MNTDPNFANNLFEKLVNLTKKNTEIKNNTPAASKSLKSTSSSSSSPNGTKSTKGGENTPIPGTPQVVDTKPTKELKHSEPGKSTEPGKNTTSISSKKTDLINNNNKSTSLLEKVKEEKGKVAEKEKQTKEAVQTGQIDTEQEKSESAQETKEREQQQVSDEWYRSPLVDFNERARALAAEKAAQMQQAHYVVAEPRTPVSKISREKTIPVQSVIGLVIISTFPIVRSLLKNVKLKEKKKKIEEKYSFFVNAHVLIRGIEIGDYLVATESCDILNVEFGLNPKIEQFMVGKVVGIIDETIYQVTIQVFPHKRFVYTNGFTYLTPFAPLDEVNSPIRPRSESNSLRSKLKIPSRQIIERYYVKIKKSKHFQNIIDFLNYEPFSSKR